MTQPSKKFTRTTEDFTCDRCGTFVEGDGYTNHCPQCLWSKHVDVHPGDRAATCGGPMEPVELEVRNGTEAIVQRCLLCGHTRKNKRQEEDSVEALIALSQVRP